MDIIDAIKDNNINKIIDILDNDIINLDKIINIQDSFKRTPLMYSCLNKNIEIVKILLVYGAEVNKKDMWGTSAVSEACLNGSLDIVKLLVENNADINKECFLYACLSGNALLVRELHKNRNIDINFKSYAGKTPLIGAVYKENIDVVKELLSIGANINIKDDHGCTALFYANVLNYKDIVDIIRQNQDTNNTNNTNDTRSTNNTRNTTRSTTVSNTNDTRAAINRTVQLNRSFQSNVNVNNSLNIDDDEYEYSDSD